MTITQIFAESSKPFSLIGELHSHQYSDLHVHRQEVSALNFQFRENLRRLRESVGLSQSRYAEAIGVSSRTVKKWESGEAFPEMSRLEDIVRPLRVLPQDLLAPIGASSGNPSTIHEALQKVRDARRQLEEAEEKLEYLLSGAISEESADRPARAEDILGEDF